MWHARVGRREAGRSVVQDQRGVKRHRGLAGHPGEQGAAGDEAASACSSTSMSGYHGLDTEPTALKHAPYNIPLQTTPTHWRQPLYSTSQTYSCCHAASAWARRDRTSAQSPRRVWRHNRMVGYQGVVSPSSCQRQSCGILSLEPGSKFPLGMATAAPRPCQPLPNRQPEPW
jgi:hypothetical protein